MVASDESTSLGEMSGLRWQIPEKSLGDNEGTMCVFPVPAAGPRMCDCPCISWEPLLWMDVGKHQSGRSSVPDRQSCIPTNSNLLHCHSQEGGRPVQEQRDSLPSQMVTHTKPAQYLGWADLTISPFKDYPLNCPSHTPPSAPA